VIGGFLVQDADAEVDDREGMEVRAGEQPDEHLWGDLLFAWRICKHVNSNAIVIAKPQVFQRRTRSGFRFPAPVFVSPS